MLHLFRLDQILTKWVRKDWNGLATITVGCSVGRFNSLLLKLFRFTLIKTLQLKMRFHHDIIWQTKINRSMAMPILSVASFAYLFLTFYSSTCTEKRLSKILSCKISDSILRWRLCLFYIFLRCIFWRNERELGKIKSNRQVTSFVCVCSFTPIYSDLEIFCKTWLFFIVGESGDIGRKGKTFLSPPDIFQSDRRLWKVGWNVSIVGP